LRARLYLLATAVLFSTGGAAIKACALTSWQIVALRSAFAVATLLIALPSTLTGWTRPVVLVGAAQAATMISFVAATKLTTAANAIFLQCTAPIYVLVLAPLVLHEPVRRSDLAFLLAFVAGLCTIFFGGDAPSATAPNPSLGNLVAIGSGVAWACTMIGFRWTARVGSVFGPAFLAGNIFGVVIALPFALPISGATPTDWAIVAFLGVVQIGLAYGLMSVGMREVPALEASLLMLLEPVLNPVWTWLVHGERVGLATLAGGAIVLAATATKTLVERRA
jgi:drug/metabolite transporter (DMT)-like permease